MKVYQTKGSALEQRERTYIADGMMGVFVTTMSLSKIDPSSVDQWLLWVTELFYSIGVFIAFGWCVFQSGTWARDFTGA